MVLGVIIDSSWDFDFLLEAHRNNVPTIKTIATSGMKRCIPDIKKGDY